MSPVRVLVVEDSLTVRRRLCEVLSADPGLVVIGEAEDGRRAIERCQALRPDVITMDMMLPVLSGLSATEYIMAYCPCPILIVSASTNRGELFKTYEALAAGAVDVLDKPLGDESDPGWELRLVAAVKMVARIRVITHLRTRLGSRPAPAPGPPPAGGERRVVAVGASTGGPGAVVELLRGLPAGFTLPVLLVLHIGAPFARALADWLDAQTGRRVSYAGDGERVADAAGRVVMAPPGLHLAVRNGCFRLHDGPERHSCRPSIDVLFESLAGEYGPAALACLLTGMGRDGAAGLLAIRLAGGATIAQDERTSVVYGMPREAALLGAAERILPLDGIAAEIARQCAGGP
jgi:two-component system chemotaxis response regulator CheB